MLHTEIPAELISDLTEITKLADAHGTIHADAVVAVWADPTRHTAHSIRMAARWLLQDAGLDVGDTTVDQLIDQLDAE